MKLFGIYKDESFAVETVNCSYECKNVILATGKERFAPKIKGIKEFEGKGVSYCAICDAFFYKNKNVAVLGSGNYAIHEAKQLLPVAKSVLLLTNGDKLVENRDINIDINEKNIKQVRGMDKVEEIEFSDNTKLKISGIFIAVGTASSTDLAKKIGAIIQNNNVKVNEKMQTSVKGLYACGDCTGGLLQISKAVYEGTVAGLAVVNNINQNLKMVPLDQMKKINGER